MTNNRMNVERRVPGVPLHDPVAWCMAQGWNDFLDGMEPREFLGKIDQMNYELGRHVAAAVASVQVVPPWNERDTYVDMRRTHKISDAGHAAMLAENTWMARQHLVEAAVRAEIEIARQQWGPAPDEVYDDGRLLAAARCYYLYASGLSLPMKHDISGKPHSVPLDWPFRRDTWTPESLRRDLVRAGAYALIERDRLARAEQAHGHAYALHERAVDALVQIELRSDPCKA